MYQPTTLPTSTQHGPHPQKDTEKFKDGYSRGQQLVGFGGGESDSLEAFLIYFRAKTSAQLTKTTQNLQSKGLRNTRVRDFGPKSASVFETFGRPFKSSYSRLRRMVG
jgi:hypothetical protein